MKGIALSIFICISNYQIISIMMILWANIVLINREIELVRLSSVYLDELSEKNCNELHSMAFEKSSLYNNRYGAMYEIIFLSHMLYATL